MLNWPSNTDPNITVAGAEPIPTAGQTKRRHRVLKLPAAAIAVVLLALMPMHQGCANPQVKTWTGVFAGCEKADLGQLVTVEGFTTGLLTAIGLLVQGNYPALESDLASIAATVGLDAVRCAIVAFEAAIATPSSGSGSGSAAPPQPQTIPPGLVRMKAWLAAQEAAAAQKGIAP